MSKHASAYRAASLRFWLFRLSFYPHELARTHVGIKVLNVSSCDLRDQFVSKSREDITIQQRLVSIGGAFCDISCGNRKPKEAGDILECEAFRRAYEGVEEPVFYKSDVSGYVRKYSDLLIMFLLNGIKPATYREKVYLSSSELDSIIEAELAKRRGDTEEPIIESINLLVHFVGKTKRAKPVRRVALLF